MKILDVTAVSDAAQIKIKKGTLKFIQDAHIEALRDLITALIGPSYNPDTIYVIKGLVNSATHPSYTISPGTIFYQGEIFEVDAFSFSVTGSNVAVLSILTTQYTTDADPVTFTDLITYNVHNIRKIGISAGAYGSTFANYSEVNFIPFVIQPPITITGDGVLGGYPNFVIPGISNTHPILYVGSYSVGDVSGGQSYSVTFPSIGAVDYVVSGSLLSGATDPANDANVFWTIRNKTSTGFTLYVRENSSSANSLVFDYALIKK